MSAAPRELWKWKDDGMFQLRISFALAAPPHPVLVWFCRYPSAGFFGGLVLISLIYLICFFPFLFVFLGWYVFCFSSLTAHTSGCCVTGVKLGWGSLTLSKCCACCWSSSPFPPVEVAYWTGDLVLIRRKWERSCCCFFFFFFFLGGGGVIFYLFFVVVFCCCFFVFFWGGGGVRTLQPKNVFCHWRG